MHRDKAPPGRQAHPCSHFSRLLGPRIPRQAGAPALVQWPWCPLGRVSQPAQQKAGSGAHWSTSLAALNNWSQHQLLLFFPSRVRPKGRLHCALTLHLCKVLHFDPSSTALTTILRVLSGTNIHFLLPLLRQGPDHPTSPHLYRNVANLCTSQCVNRPA